MSDDELPPAPPAPPAGASELDQPEPEKPAWVLVAQFFVIPLVVVVLAVSVFLLFGWFSREKRSAGEQLQEVRTGSLNRRWQAAFELSKELARNPELGRDEALFRQTLEAFEGARDDAKIRRYLALALGHFARPEAVSALAAALGDGDEETQVYAALALGTVKSPEGVAPLVQALTSEAASLRKVAAFALGQIGSLEALPALRVAAEDRRFDVSLQAACSLAQLGSADGVTVLHRALDRNVVDAVAEMSAEQKDEAMANAMRALVLLRDPGATERLQALSRSDPSLRVRDAALRALAALEAGPGAGASPTPAAP